MLSPGSKGWINKYFAEIAEGTINAKKIKPYKFDTERYIHLLVGKAGLIFGHSGKSIFTKHLDDSKWTSEEKLKLLLFESLLLVFQQKYGETDGKKEEFVESLLGFYSKHNSKNLFKKLTFFIKDSPETVLENIFSKRVDIKLNLLENKWWVSSMNNVFVFLDVILYYRYLHTEDQDSLEDYSDYALNALTAITLAAYSDGKIEGREKTIFDLFLASANLKDESREKAIQLFKDGASFADFTNLINKDWMFRMFLVDLCLLTIYSNHEALATEVKFIQNLCEFLGIEEADLDVSMALMESFLVQSHKDDTILSDSNSYEKVYSSLASRWTKVIIRNKEKLTTELKESKELVSLIKKSATQELTKEEREMVKTQFMDIVKSMPALAIFMLPGGAILLPLILKLLPDLIPSAFRENEVDE